MKRILKALLGLLAVIVIFAGGYIIYMQVQYYRIEDNAALVVSGTANQMLEVGDEYSVVTWNLGFGAYNHDFSFFMDSGTMKDGTTVTGTMSRAQSVEIVDENIGGAIEKLKEEEPDFVLLQEVDVDATRSFGIDERVRIQSAFPNHLAVYSSNFHSAYLLYPFHEPHGSVEAGLLTLSQYRIDSAARRSYPVSTAFPTKFFDLDRCFSVQRLPVEGGRELVLINSHMSAYDEGGTIRAQQMEMLCAVLQEERAHGNYVIVGGDFNHALCGTIEAFPSQQEIPEWVFAFDDTLLPEGYSVVAAENLTKVATCRSTDIPYTKSVNYESVLDGFIVSDNLCASAENLDMDYAFSDHNPVRLIFRLNP